MQLSDDGTSVTESDQDDQLDASTSDAPSNSQVDEAPSDSQVDNQSTRPLEEDPLEPPIGHPDPRSGGLPTTAIILTSRLTTAMVSGPDGQPTARLG